MSPPREVLDALLLAGSLSTCAKSKRGAVLLDCDNVMHFGCNRPAVGVCDGSEKCRADCGRTCNHAEEVAVLSAGHKALGAEVFHLKVVDGRGVASGPPSCVTCSRLMLRAHVAGMWLLTERGWRRWTAQQFHEATLNNLKLHRSDQ